MIRKQFVAPRLIEVASLMTLTQMAAAVSGAAGDDGSIDQDV